MKLAARKATARNAAVAGLAAVALLGATGCSAINQQATTLQYAPSDGIVANVGEAELRNIALITSGPDTEARYIGTIAADTSEQDLEVSITVAGTETLFSVPAGESLKLEDPANEQVIPSSGGFPGSMVEATVEVTGGPEAATEQVDITVLDGTLPEYRPFVPGGANPATDDHLYATPAAEEGGH
ncbi:MAG: hypothetical protein QJR09_00550 [Micrococcus sp.]|nr:hypothetical protein [Micrococcus sp.]